MRGLEISESFYNEYSTRLFKEFDVMSRAATGLAGEGSECLGYDDAFSHDHDFDPGFCIWLTEEDYEKYGFALSRAYSRLPKEYMGLKRGLVSPVGGDRRGVMSIGEFYTRHIGSPAPPESNYQWLYTPPYALRAATSGKVFFDGAGRFSQIRDILKQGYPPDVKRKKIAAHLALMAQAGQYNYGRCVTRKESGAAALCAHEFVIHAIALIYLINDVYQPFYKWAFRGLKELERLSDLEFTLSELIQTGNGEKEGKQKQDIIEDVAAVICAELCREGLSFAQGSDLEKHALSVTKGITDAELRNMHIMEGIS